MYASNETARAFASEATDSQPFAAFIARTATVFSSSLIAVVLLATAIHH
jgi:hypothetical protein